MNSQKIVDEEFEIISFSDCWNEYEENLKKLNKQIYIEDGCIVLDINYKYCIELNRCDTPDKLLRWVYHLLGKVWMNTELLEDFIIKVAKYHKFNIYGLS